MSDARTREFERAWQAGDVEAGLRVLVEKLREDGSPLTPEKIWGVLLESEGKFLPVLSYAYTHPGLDEGIAGIVDEKISKWMQTIENLKSYTATSMNLISVTYVLLGKNERAEHWRRSYVGGWILSEESKQRTERLYDAVSNQDKNIAFELQQEDIKEGKGYYKYTAEIESDGEITTRPVWAIQEESADSLCKGNIIAAENTLLSLPERVHGEIAFSAEKVVAWCTLATMLGYKKF